MPGWNGKHITTADLKSNERLLGELWPLFVVDGKAVADTPENRLTFVALAEHAIRKGDPPAQAGRLFVDHLKHWRTRTARPSAADDAAAATRIREWQEQVGHD